MGLLRKATSVSTLGGVKYTSKREAATKASLAEARLADAQAKQVKKQGQQARQQDAAAAAAAKWGPVVEAIEAGQASWDDLSRVQKLSMPVGYQLRCRAAGRRRAGL